MVRGLDIFRGWFSGYSNQYVLIGGTAASLTMEEVGLAFRATKDLEIVLHVEALTPAFEDACRHCLTSGAPAGVVQTFPGPTRFGLLRVGSP